LKQAQLLEKTGAALNLRSPLSLATITLVVLVITTAANRYTLEIGPATVRLEHIALAGLLVAWGIKFARGRSKFHLNKSDLLLPVYLLVAFVASYFNAPSFFDSLKFLVLMGIALAIYFVIQVAVTGEPEFRLGVRLLFYSGAVISSLGIVAWLLYPVGLNLGITLYRVQSGPADVAVPCTFSPHLTLIEPNILGGYLAATGLLGLYRYLEGGVPRYWLLLSLTVFPMAVGLSLTRSAWMAYMVGLVLLVLFSKTRKLAFIYSLGSMGLLLASLLIAANYQLGCRLLLPENPNEPVQVVLAQEESSVPGQTGVTTHPVPINGPAGEKTGSRLLTSDSVGWRLDTFQNAFNDWLENPLPGNGANSYAQKYTTTSNSPGWIGNMLLMALHDTGLIGLTLLSGWFILLGRETFRALKTSALDRSRGWLGALCLCVVALLVAYQFTTAFWLGYSWVILGLLRAGIRLNRRQSSI
jgi:hypothetical protein